MKIGVKQAAPWVAWVLYFVFGAALLRAQKLPAQTSQAARESSEQNTDSHEMLFKIINFTLLAGALGYLLRKPASEYFAQRSDSVRKGLEQGRKALEEAGARLGAVEEKLARLEEEITSLKAAAASEMQIERQRLRKAAAEEAQKMDEFARAQVDAALRAARLQLKKFTAQKAVELADGSLRARLDEAGHRRLFTQFLLDLEAGRNKN